MSASQSELRAGDRVTHSAFRHDTFTIVHVAGEHAWMTRDGGSDRPSTASVRTLTRVVPFWEVGKTYVDPSDGETIECVYTEERSGSKVAVGWRGYPGSAKDFVMLGRFPRGWDVQA